jgi:hypothetical protein
MADYGSINDYMNQGGSPWDTAQKPDSGFDPTSYLQSADSMSSLFGGGGASPFAALGMESGLAGGLANLFGANSGGTEGATLGTLALGPLGGILGGVLGNVLAGGVPTGAKTQGAQAGLEGSGNPLLEMLGSYMQGAGGGQGSNVLSNPKFAGKTNTFADILQWLSGQQLPGYKQMGTTGEIAGIPAPQGAPYKKPVNIMGIQNPLQLQGELGFSPNLSPDQIQGLLPKIQQLLSGGGDIASLKGPLAQLVKGAGSTGANAGANGPVGAAGLGLDLMGGNDELASILKAALQRGQQQPSTPSPWDQVRS